MEQLPESSVSLPIICKYRSLPTQIVVLGKLCDACILRVRHSDKIRSVFAAIYVITALIQNLLSILWSVYMVRAWLRPPDDCFHRAAVPLPAIVIWIVFVVSWRRNPRRICACVNLRDELRGCEQDEGHITFEDKQERESVKCDHEIEAVASTANRCSQGEQATGKICRWHSSLDSTDNLFFLVALLLVLLWIIAIMIVLPYKQGYYWYVTISILIEHWRNEKCRNVCLGGISSLI